jgi:hypothetical protein
LFLDTADIGLYFSRLVNFFLSKYLMSIPINNENRQMYTVRSIGNAGAHGQAVLPEDAAEAISKICGMID